MKQNIIDLAMFIIGAVGLLLMIGSVGAYEQDTISATQALIQAAIGYVLIMVDIKIGNIR